MKCMIMAVILIGNTCLADKDSKIITSLGLATKGFTIQAKEIGDLNKDGLNDVIVILTRGTSKKTDETEEKALLRIYFSDKDGKLSLATEAKDAVCLNCGGMNAPTLPFTLKIKNGVLHLTHAGGSRESFETTTKWRFNNGSFFLIGVDSLVEDSMASDPNAIISIRRDANILSLKMDETILKVPPDYKEGSKDRKPVVKKVNCAVVTGYKEKKLNEYSDAFEIPKCSSETL